MITQILILVSRVGVVEILSCFFFAVDIRECCPHFFMDRMYILEIFSLLYCIIENQISTIIIIKLLTHYSGKSFRYRVKK